MSNLRHYPGLSRGYLQAAALDILPPARSMSNEAGEEAKEKAAAEAWEPRTPLPTEVEALRIETERADVAALVQQIHRLRQHLQLPRQHFADDALTGPSALRELCKELRLLQRMSATDEDVPFPSAAPPTDPLIERILDATLYQLPQDPPPSRVLDIPDAVRDEIADLRSRLATVKQALEATDGEAYTRPTFRADMEQLQESHRMQMASLIADYEALRQQMDEAGDDETLKRRLAILDEQMASERAHNSLQRAIQVDRAYAEVARQQTIAQEAQRRAEEHQRALQRALAAERAELRELDRDGLTPDAFLDSHGGSPRGG